MKNIVGGMLMVLLGGVATVNAQVARAPFEVKGKHMFIKVGVKNSDSLSFIFDTGAASALIDSATAEKLGISKENRQTVEAGGSGGSQNYTMVSGQDFRVAGLEFKNNDLVLVNFNSLSASIGSPIQGIVGFEVLNKYVTVMDFEQKQLLMYKDIADLDTTGYIGIPFEFSKGMMIPRFPITAILSNGEKFTGKVMFDSGSGSPLVISASFNKFHGISEKIAGRLSSTGRGLAAETKDERAMISGISFNGFELGEMPVELSDVSNATGKDGYLGIMGLAVIRRFSVIIDYAHKKIYLKPNAQYQDAFDKSTYESLLKVENNAFLEKNKLKPGVVVLPSGLQYKVVNKGAGPVAGPEAKVVIDYVAMLVNGKEFMREDAKELYAVKNQPFKAWAEAFPMMQAGAKWILYAPSNMAFGNGSNYGRIPRNSNIIFEVVLKKILKPTAAAVQASVFLNKNKVKAGVKTTKSGLQYKVLLAGKGEKARVTDLALLKYKLTLINGKKVGGTDSLTKAQFLDQEMPAIREAVPLMAPGAKYRLFIPNRLGFPFLPEGVEDGSLVICDIELVKTTRDLQREMPHATPAQNVAFMKENGTKAGVVVLPSGLQYKVLKEGTGLKPGAGDKVEVHYVGTQVNGKIFDSSLARGAALKIGVTDVIAGWTEALQLMKEGSKWVLYIPSELAYGERGSGSSIPANANLIFEVELLKVVK